jgi:hypothetical protein
VEEMKEEVQAMSAVFEYLTLFDFIIAFALVGILCCGLFDVERT